VEPLTASPDGTIDVSPLPADWHDAVRLRLKPGERLLSWFAPDLCTRLQYREGLVVLTDRRLLAAPAEVAALEWESWDLQPELSLTQRDRSGLGALDLFGPKGRLGHWRFTLARASTAHRFRDAFASALHHGPAAVSEPEVANCPSCGEPLPAGTKECPTCAPSGVVNTSVSLLRLLRFARPRFGAIVLGFVLTLTSTAAGLIPPYLTIPLLDKVLYPRRDFHLVKWYVLGLFGAAVLAWLLTWARSYVVAWVSERIASDLRNQTYEHLQKLSLEYFGGKRTGDLMARLSSDTERLNTFLSVNLLDFGSDVVMMAMTAALLLLLDPTLAVVTLLPFPLIAWLVQVYRGKLRRSFQRSARAWSEMTSVLADTIPGIRVVKAFAQEQREVERFRRSDGHVLHANDHVNTIWSFFSPLVNLLTQMGLLVIWGFGAWQVSRGGEVGVLVGFQLLISRFYVRLESMSRIVQATQRAGTSTQRIFEILDRSPSVAEPARPVAIGDVRGEIELKHIGFRHGSRMILDDVDLHIRPGEMIGLVGATGAGKSTLVNLVCRFYDVGEGAILVDGVDIRSYPVSDYRRQIGIVLQEPFLFFGTIAENIAYGRPEATRAEIISAARAARCHDFILRLPDGYDSLVGERGQSLSGGERQRLSIARALLIDPAILILDEANEAVDTETEREIQEALDNLIRGRTTIAIAHRLSTLRKADRLVVLERGRVVEVGQHHDLMKVPGVYARLHKAQAELAAGLAH
jgi:ATP-binding cassette, subfamily B, bacterial